LNFTTDDYIQFGDVLDIGSGDWSYSIWFKTTDTQGSLLSKSIYGGQVGRWWLTITGGNYEAGLQTALSGVDMIITTASAELDDQWHIATVVIRRGSNMELWIDGDRRGVVDVSAGAGENLQTTNDLLAGRYNSVSGTGPHPTFGILEGQLDNIDIYSRALAPQEIATLAEYRGIAYEMSHSPRIIGPATAAEVAAVVTILRQMMAQGLFTTPHGAAI
jgi:hypothetical protein